MEKPILNMAVIGPSQVGKTTLITPLPLTLRDRGILMANGHAIGECFVTDIMA